MRAVYEVVINALVFFFIVTVFNGVQLNGSSTLLAKIVAAIIFGLVMLAVPNILKAMKIPDTTGARLLLGLVLSFAFFFILYTGVGSVATIGGSTIDLGLGPSSIIKLAGSLETLIAVSIATAFTSAGIYALSRRS